MLQQSFDSKAVSRALMPKDFVKWPLRDGCKDIDEIVSSLSVKIREKGYDISPFRIEKKKEKDIFVTSNEVDDVGIRVLDRYVRRIYKVRQSDRNRIVGQIKKYLMILVITL